MATDDRWHGWPSAANAPRAPSGWIELSHPLSADLPPWRTSGQIAGAAARFERIMSMPRDPLNVTEMQMTCHFGTHIDAPRHFIPDGPAVDQIPLDRLHGPGVVWQIDCEPWTLIDVATLAAQRPLLEPDDILFVDTGWAAHLTTERYHEHPSFSTAAAEWLVAQRIKLLGIDCLTPDLTVPRRPQGFDWPVHHILLGHGILIAENLTNLRALAGRRIEAMCFALPIAGADGAPTRVIARPR